MPEHLYLLSISLPFATILLVFAMRYVSAVMQARARLAHEDAYRQIAQKSVAAESETAGSLVSIQRALGDFAERLASIEKILKEVG